jgi:hypothetical protein
MKLPEILVSPRSYNVKHYAKEERNAFGKLESIFKKPFVKH